MYPQPELISIVSVISRPLNAVRRFFPARERLRSGLRGRNGCRAFAALVFSFLLGAASLQAISPSITFTGAFTTLLGSGAPVGTQSLSHPYNCAVDSAGNVYVADYGNKRIVKIAPDGASSVVNTGNVALGAPSGVAVDSLGNLFIADHATGAYIVEVASDGTASTIAPVGASLSQPFGIMVDGSGNLYIADTGNNKIIKMTQAGAARVVSTDHIRLYEPVNTAMDPNGNLYIVDNEASRVVKVEPNGEADFVNTWPYFLDHPYGIAIDASGNIFINDGLFHHILELPVGGNPRIVNANNLGLSSAVGISVQPSTGNLYLADVYSNRCLKGSASLVDLGSVNMGQSSNSVSLNYFISRDNTTLGGIQILTKGAPNLDFQATPNDKNTLVCTTASPYNSGWMCTVDVTFTPGAVGFREGAVILTDSGGNILSTAYLAGIGTAPVVSYPPGTAGVAGTGSVPISFPAGEAMDGAGNLYVADSANNQVVQITPSGTSSVFGTGSFTLANPNGVAVDGAGNVLISDSVNSRILKVALGGATTVVGTGSIILGATGGVAVDRMGNIFIADSGNNQVVEVRPGGAAAALNTGSISLGLVSDVAVDGSGNAYIADSTNNQVVMVPPAGSAAALNTGTLTLNTPARVAADQIGNIYISDQGNNRVVEVNVAGNASALTTGSLTLSIPGGVAVSDTGVIYIGDTGNSRIVQLDASGAPALTFADTIIGQTSSDSPIAFTLQNAGNATLALSGIVASDSYAETDTCNGSVAVGGNCSLSVSFTPTAVGAKNGSLTITDNAAGSPQTVTLNGTGVLPVASISSASLAFGNQLTGSTSDPQALTLSNTGTGVLKITSLVASSGYAETDTCNNPVGAGENCTIKVTFSPTATGSVNGTLTITDNAADSPQTVTLSGTGVTPVAALSTSSLNFSSQLVGSNSNVQPVTLSNTGTAALNITSIVASGDFSQTNTCGSSVAASGQCTISVVFSPASSGSLSGTLTITDSATGSPHSVALGGTGVTPVIALSTSSLNFSSQLVGSNSSVQPVTLSNTGTAALNITSIVASGDFSQTNTCGSSVAASGQCTISVVFSPTGTGSLSGTLTITDSATGSPHSVTLGGTGVMPVAALSTSSLNFSSQLVGSSSNVQPVTLSNTGTAALNITSIVASGDFSQTNTCGSSVAAAGQCTISVVFSPASTGSLSGTLTITDSATGSPHSVTLGGTGVTPVAALSTSSLNFSSQLVGSNSNVQPVTLSNTGTAALNITSIVASGDFSQTNTCGSSVAAAGQCTISVVFSPASTGSLSGTLTITDSATGSPHTVALTGTGEDFTVVPASGSSNSATVAAGSPANYSLNVTGEDWQNHLVTFTCTGAPAHATCTVSPSSVTPTGSTINLSVTVSTTAGSQVTPRSKPMPPAGNGLARLWPFGLLALASLGLATQARRWGARLGWRASLLPLAVLLLVLAAASCDNEGRTVSTSTAGTPAGNYTLIVTGQATSGSNTISHSVSLTLKVQ